MTGQMAQEIIDIICESESGAEREVSDGNKSSDNDNYEDERDNDDESLKKMTIWFILSLKTVMTNGSPWPGIIIERKYCEFLY